MKNKLLFAFSMLLMVVSAGAQTTRIKLTQIEKANTVNGTKANQVPVSNGVGDLRYSQYVEINPTSIGYTPAATGNPVANYSQFVRPANNDIWYIDGQGQGIRLYVSASAGDYDWLEIGNNQIPNSITDSIYKYRYASIGGRLVWPTAELLVVDSAAQGMFIVSGNRKAKIALYDNDNMTWSTIEQGGGSTNVIMQVGGTFTIQTAGSGTPQAPGSPVVEHFVINGDSSINFPQYKSTRTDPGTPTVLFGPDVNGKMRNYAVSSFISEILPVPPLFPYYPPFDILIGQDTFIVNESEFSLKAHAGITPIDTLYVNVAVSSSGTGQSWATAIKGLDEAIVVANATSGAKQIRVAKGYYTDQNSWNAVEPTKSLEIIGDLTQGSGTGIFLTTDVRDLVGSFTLISNYYRATLTQRPGRVYDRSQTDAFGDMRTLTRQTSIASVNTNPGSWYWNADTIYIRNFDSRVPDANNVYALNQYNGFMLKDSVTLYLKSLNFIGGGLSFGIPYTTGVGPTNIYIDSITVKGVNGYALSGAGISELIVFNSAFAKTDSNDVIGYDKRNLVIPNIVEYNVTSYNSSEQNTACGTCNASTSHYNTIVRVNGRYSHTYGPTIADVLGSNSWNIGVKSFNSRTLADPRAYYFGTINLPGYYYLQDCKSLNQPTLGTDIVADNQTVNTRNFTGTKTNLVAGTGKVIPHYTYNSDRGGGGTVISGLTDDYIVKANGTDNVQNSSLFDNGTQVGFNTNTPEATFHIKKSNVTGSAAAGSFGVLLEDGGANAVFGIQSDMARYAEIVFGDQWSLADGGMRYSLSTRSTNRKQLQFFTDGFANTAMVIDSTRKVGINNASPESQLHVTQSDVSGSFPAGWAVGIEHNSDDVVLGLKTNAIRSNRLWFGDNTNNALGAVFYYGSSHATLPNHMQLWTAGTAKLWLDEAGRLGIGSDPVYPLDVVSTGSMRIPTGNTAQRGTAAAGVIRHNTDLNQFEGSGTGATYYSFPQTLFSATSNTVVTNTTVVSNLASVSVPANSLAAGQTIRIQVEGFINTDAVAPGNGRIGIVYGTDTIYSATKGIAAISGAAVKTFTADFSVRVSAAGASGSMRAQGLAQYETDPLSPYLGLMYPFSNPTISNTTVNTTTTKTLSLFWQFSTADADNGIVITNAAITRQ